MEPWYSMFMGLVSPAGLPGQALLESRVQALLESRLCPSWRCEPHFSAFWIWESRQNPDLYVKCPDISILATSLK